jgi:hypothetical protein
MLKVSVLLALHVLALHVLLVQRLDGVLVRGPQKEFRHLNLNPLHRVERVAVQDGRVKSVPSIHHMERDVQDEDVKVESIIVGREVLVQLRKRIVHVIRVLFLLSCKTGKL